MTKLKRILRDKKGVSFPLTVAITLALIIILCGVTEYFRLNIIASGVKEALQDAIIVTVNDNYADVYHGVREGYSGGYQPDGESFSYSVNTGDIYSCMDSTLGTEEIGGNHIKTTGGVTWLIDSWTPTGMLSMNLTDTVTIRGNLWTDWHIAPQNPN